MTTSDAMVALIKSHEGYRDTVYRCPAGIWTIGYGHTGKDTTIAGWKDADGDYHRRITAEVADQLLRKDLRWAELAIEKVSEAVRLRTGRPLIQQQFDALVSFIYNVGTGSFDKSTLRRYVLTPGVHENTIVREFMKWDKATVNGEKVVLSGLQKRRSVEAAFWVFGPNWAERLKKQNIDVMLWAKQQSGRIGI